MEKTIYKVEITQKAYELLEHHTADIIVCCECNRIHHTDEIITNIETGEWICFECDKERGIKNENN